MKELIFAIQFIISQETYIASDKVINKITGRASYNNEVLYLVVDQTINEYKVSHIESAGDSHLVLFEKEGIYGTLKATKDNLYFDFYVKDSTGVSRVKVIYKVKKTNFNETVEMFGK